MPDADWGPSAGGEGAVHSSAFISVDRASGLAVVDSVGCRWVSF